MNIEQIKLFLRKYRGLILLLAILLLCFGCANYISNTLTDETEKHDAEVDAYMTVIYESKIKPAASIEIKEILNKVAQISNPHDKLTAIADWQTRGFTNILVENRNDNYVTQKIGRYTYDDAGNVRAEGGSRYNGDPYWITYYKYGACGEFANLFSYLANESGFETRIVVANEIINADNPVGRSNHAWVEVKINDEWMYYDPAAYYDNSRYNLSNNPWYGKLEERKLWDWTIMSLYDEGKNDVHSRYPNIPYEERPEIIWSLISDFYIVKLLIT